MIKPPIQASIAILALGSLLGAQAATASSIQKAPKSVLDGFQVRAASMQDLDLPQQSVAGFEVTVRLAGRNMKLVLRAKDIRAKNYKLLVYDANGLHETPRSPNVTYQGSVEGYPSSRVAATLFRGQLTAMIAFLPNQPLWNVQPRTEVDKSANPKTHVMHSSRDSVAPQHQCGVKGHSVPTTTRRTPTLNSSAANRKKYAEIASDADNAYYARKGRSVSSTEAAVNTVMNGVETIYDRDVDLKYLITRIIVRTSKVYSGTSTGSLLSEMRSRWGSNHGGIKRDMAHMFTGVGSFSGVIGTAYLGVVCGSSAYGVSKAYHSSNSTNVGLVSHEAGHNWGAGHCSGNTCYIMCSGLGGCGSNLTKFGSSSKSTIIGFANGLGCLDLDPWLRIGGGISGQLGNPRFKGEGFIKSTTNPPKITLSNYRPNSLGVFVIGLTPLKISYFGGLLVPSPDVAVGISGNGSPMVLDASALKNASIANLWAQAFYIDAAAQQGVSATSGYRIFVK
ncbi:MAG: M12 family metallo-peptidase [Planctomycetota bacterium]|nr:M12 family metallo-peptidase [Planctomycetota bacterium]